MQWLTSGGVSMRRAKVTRTRRAGFVGEAEYGVVTIKGESTDKHGHRLTPCPTCPWRLDATVGAFPAEAYRLSAPTSYDMAQSTFACHESGSAKPQTCASFLLRQHHNMAVRLACIMGKLDLSRVHDGGVRLYADYRAMAEANGVDPADPVLGPCR
jgi:hypothetical protein